MQPKRVLILSLSYYPRFVGGAEVAIKEITDRLPDVEFHMVTLRYDSNLPKHEKIGKVFVYRIGFAVSNPSIADLRKFPLRLNKFLFQFLAVPHALSLHAKYRYDALWAMMAHACGIPAGLFTVVNPRVPYLLTLQEGDPPESIERAMRPVWPLFTQGFARADALQAISTFLAEWGKRMGFHGAADIIPNGVDGTRFAGSFSESELSDARARIGKEQGNTVLITASRLVHKNAVDDVISSLSHLPETVSFAVCGIGPDEAKLRAHAAERGVTERVRFLGEVSHEELPKLLAASDIFIRPSRSEGMGNAFIEAMAAGIPVVATQEGGIRDFLFDAKRNPDQEPTGYAVDANSPMQIAEAVTRILEHPQETARTVENAKKLALKDYGWDGISARMKAVFERLFSHGRLRP